MLRTEGSIPVGTAKNKRRNRPKKSVFLLSFANFSEKTGAKNSYAPRVPLLDIFQRTRDHRTHIATVKNQSDQKDYTLTILTFGLSCFGTIQTKTGMADFVQCSTRSCSQQRIFPFYCSRNIMREISMTILFYFMNPDG